MDWSDYEVDASMISKGIYKENQKRGRVNET